MVLFRLKDKRSKWNKPEGGALRKKSPCMMVGRGELRKDLSSGWLDSLSGAAKEVNSHGRRAHGNYFYEKIHQLILIPFFSWKVFQASTQQQLKQENNVPPRKETTSGRSPLSLARNTLYWNVLTTRHGAHSSKISNYDCSIICW